MQVKKLECPTCGAPLVPKSPNDKVVMCEYCGTVVYLQDETKVVYVEGVSQKDRGETELAMISLNAENYESAKVKFEAAIANNVKNNVAWLGKASADLHLGNLKESLMAFKKVIDLNSELGMVISWGNYLIDTANFYSGKYEKQGEEEYKRSMNAKKRNEYMVISKRYKDYARAIVNAIYSYYLKKLDESELGEDMLQYGLHLSLIHQDYANMYKISKVIMSKNSQDLSGPYYRGLSSLYLGNYNEAVAMLQPLLQRTPNNYNVYIYLAYAYERLWQYRYACDLLVSGYGYTGNKKVLESLKSIYKDWIKTDKRSAKMWKVERKQELKKLHILYSI